MDNAGSKGDLLVPKTDFLSSKKVSLAPDRESFSLRRDSFSVKRMSMSLRSSTVVPRRSSMASKCSYLDSLRRSGPASHESLSLTNYTDDMCYRDSLHQKYATNAPCSGSICVGSKVFTDSHKASIHPRTPDEVLIDAKSFIDQFFEATRRTNTPEHHARWEEIQASVKERHTYDLTSQELCFGTKLAWRNSPRCIGRIQWTKLQFFDARNIYTARGMFEAICHHIEYATNKGNIRSAITVFPKRIPGRGDFRIWNAQLIRYAGYVQTNGDIIGDPINVDFTRQCVKLGWTPKYGMFDVLPLVVSAGGDDPEVFDLPPELILEVTLSHPQYPWFEKLGLRWYGLPALSGMLLDVGGLEFPACPFNGWYMSTEIGARDLSDVQRYNMLEKVALQMGLDLSSNINLWRDTALVEINKAVLHSFLTAGVTITDHHSASDSFIKHMAREHRVRGGCPADWVWIVPPLSGGITEVFHQEMLNYRLKPSFLYQENAWRTHTGTNYKKKASFVVRKEDGKIALKPVVRAVIISQYLQRGAMSRRIKCTILFATENGKAEKFASILMGIFKQAFDAKVMCMDNFPAACLEHETLVLIVASTFGNGEAPDNGKEFAKGLSSMLDEMVLAEEEEYRSELRTGLGRGRTPSTGGLVNFRHGRVSIRKQSSQRFSNEPPKTPLGTRAKTFLDKVFTCMKPSGPSDVASATETVAVKDGTPSRSVTAATSTTVKERTSKSTPVTTLASVTGVASSLHIMDPPQGGPLLNLRYSVFALGSRAYPHFAAFGHHLNDVMNQLGAESILAVGEGDELSGQEHSFRKWTKDVFDAALKSFSVTNIVDVHVSEWSADNFRLVPASRADNPDISAALSQVHGKPISSRTLVSRTQLQAPESPNQTILVRLQAQHFDEMNYVPGDHVGIYPANNQRLVEGVISRLKDVQDPDAILSAEAQRKGKLWQRVDKMPECSLRLALTHLVDLTTPPSQELLQHLAALAHNGREKKRLETLSKESDTYDKWRHHYYPNMLDILTEFPSVEVPAAVLVTHLPPLQQRLYSISSSPNNSPGQMDLTISVHSFSTRDGKGPLKEGVCSSWLNSCQEGTTVPCCYRGSPYFHMPKDPYKPVVLVGPGTAIASYRSFWQQRYEDLASLKSETGDDDARLGHMTVFFGCRMKSLDNIYGAELEEMSREGVITEYHIAESRADPNNKVYVQDMMLQHSESIVKDLTIGHLYICGAASMAEGVVKNLLEVYQNCGWTEKEAREEVRELWVGEIISWAK